MIEPCYYYWVLSEINVFYYYFFLLKGEAGSCERPLNFACANLSINRNAIGIGKFAPSSSCGFSVKLCKGLQRRDEQLLNHAVPLGSVNIFTSGSLYQLGRGARKDPGLWNLCRAVEGPVANHHCSSYPYDSVNFRCTFGNWVPNKLALWETSKGSHMMGDWRI